MTNAELKTALLTESPVRCDGISYARISGILYRKGKGIEIFAELMDKTERSITVVKGEKVEHDIKR